VAQPLLLLWSAPARDLKILLRISSQTREAGSGDDGKNDAAVVAEEGTVTADAAAPTAVY
jgi:hypothetical protein